MAERYEIQQGDCMNSIAFDHGFFWETLWNHADNAILKQTRKDPNVLLAGDLVFIPDLREKEEAVATEKRHRFRRKGVPSKLKLRLMREDKPRAWEKYTLDVDGSITSGTTDGDGWLECSIPPSARNTKLMLSDGTEEYALQLGQLDPIDEITGIQARLQSLGFYAGSVDGQLSAETQEAIAKFQAAHGLQESGQPDQPFKDKLAGEFGS